MKPLIEVRVGLSDSGDGVVVEVDGEPVTGEYELFNETINDGRQTYVVRRKLVVRWVPNGGIRENATEEG